MGRGLSGLMQKILVTIWQRKGIIFVSDLLLLLWGPELAGGRQPFSRNTVGADEYVKNHVVLSRSINRLRRRGLLRVFKDAGGGQGTIAALTSLGEEWGRWLEFSAKQVEGAELAQKKAN
jgi:hypothetical protein